MSIKEQAKLFTSKGLTFFTAPLIEEQTGDNKPKKVASLPTAYQDFKPNNWKSTHIMSNHNAIALCTGSKHQHLLLIDWDFQYWNMETKSFEVNQSIVDAYSDMVEKLGGSIDTYTETTGNGGMHWIYKYDPVKVGFIIKQKTGFIYNGIKCGDIKGEGGFIYTAPTSYTSVKGDIKSYDVMNDVDIALAPDALYKLIPFEAYTGKDAVKPSNNKITIKNKKLNNNKTGTKANSATIADALDSGVSVSGSNTSEDNEEEVFEHAKEFNSERDKVIVYLDCINPEGFDEWRDVGFSLSKYKHYHKLCHLWAKQSKKYDYNTTEDLLINGNGAKSIGSLYYMALKTKKKYNEIVDSLIETDKELQTMLETFNDNDISKFYYKNFQYSYIYDENTKTWYSLNDKNIWDVCDAYPESLKTSIIKYITDKLKQVIKQITIKMKVIADFIKANKDVEGMETKVAEKSNELKNLNCTVALYNKYICKIGGSKFIKNVIEMLQVYYINKNVAMYLTTQTFNKHKLAFTNGLYDLNQKLFRDIEATDYIIVHCGYDYTPTPNKGAFDFVKKTIMDITDMCEEARDIKEGIIEELDYIDDYTALMNILASVLFGMNKRRKMYIFTGSGANGKSIICDSLLKPALGDYYKTMDSTFYTNTNKNAGSATPETADKNYCRALITSEPEGDDKLQVGKIKNITGLEDITSRQLYKKGFVYLPQFTPIMLCNTIPDFNRIDKAIVQRVDVYKFKNKFIVKEKPKVKEGEQELSIKYERFEKPYNGNLVSQLMYDEADNSKDNIKVRQAFIYMLIEHYKTMDNTRRCKSSIDATGEFTKANNPILEFITNVVERKADNKTQAIDMYNAYIRFCLDRNIKPLSNIAFSKLMVYNDFEKKSDTTHKTYWLGCGFIQTQVNDEADTAD